MIAAKKLGGTRHDGTPIICTLYHTGKRRSYRRGRYTVRPPQETYQTIMHALRLSMPGDIWIEDTDHPATK
jgi:hypothetical protein